MRGVWKWVVRIGLGLVVLVAALIGAFAWRLNAQLDAAPPALEGQADLRGASAPIDIIRDAYGVPHIFAASETDLYRGLGFAHAQDRFVQMDLTRRAMQGRLSEIVGDRGLETDARARMMGWASAAQAMYDHLSQDAKAVIDAYAEGVNAALKAMPEPAEYALFFAKPAPWAPVDSLAVALAMTDTLTSGDEADRRAAMLARALTPEQQKSFMPTYPDWAARSYGAGEVKTGAAAAVQPDHTAPGSNAWVVAGARTPSGKPLLANDPHLPLTAPGPFYLARLHGPDGPIIGASLPGAPMIVIGRTNDLAWGTTTHAVDTVDETPIGEDQVAETREEIIRVNVLGLFMREVGVTVRRTADGRAVMAAKWFAGEDSYKLAYGDRLVAVSSIANDPNNGVAEATYRATKAKTVAAYIAALKPWTAPPQNLVVADAKGAIGLVSPGRFPKRDAAGARIGDIPDRIFAMNPPRGYFATANNLQTGRDFPHPMPGGHDPYRVTLIDEALAKDSRHGLDQAMALQTDQQVLLARRLAPAIAAGAPKTAEGRAMQTALAGWTFNAGVDSREATQFAYWLRAIGQTLYADELGAPLFKHFQGPREVFIDSVLIGGAAPDWCDDKTTPTVETCPQTVGAALDKAAQALVRERGARPEGWAWGPVHAARFRNLIWSGLPLVGEGFTVEVPFGGSGTSINVARNQHTREGYHTVHAAGMRMIVDFADLNASKFIVAPGQSGHPRSPHYRDLAPLWAQGRYIEIRDDWTPEAMPAGARRLTLAPKN